MSYLILIICWIDRAFTTLIFLPMLYILYRKFSPTKPWTPRTMRLYLVCKVLVILFLVRIFCAGSSLHRSTMSASRTAACFR